jgi:hypothetical protein
MIPIIGAALATVTQRDIADIESSTYDNAAVAFSLPRS